MEQRSLQQLLQEHRGTHARLDRLLAGLDQAPDDSAVGQVLDEFRGAMPGHIVAEDQGLFPKLGQVFPDRIGLIRQMVDQHRQIADTLEQLAGEAPAPPADFPVRVRAWSALVREHMQVEDEVLFQGADDL